MWVTFFEGDIFFATGVIFFAQVPFFCTPVYCKYSSKLGESDKKKGDFIFF